MPTFLGTAVGEMFSAVQPSVPTMYQGLTHVAASAILAPRVDAQKDTYLPNMVVLRMDAHMTLTRGPLRLRSGSDAYARAAHKKTAAIKSPRPKIFYLVGGHEMADHHPLLLDQNRRRPRRHQGRALFIVPSFMSKENGLPGDRNAVFPVGSIGKKWDSTAIPRCVMEAWGAVENILSAASGAARIAEEHARRRHGISSHHGRWTWEKSVAGTASA